MLDSRRGFGLIQKISLLICALISLFGLSMGLNGSYDFYDAFVEWFNFSIPLIIFLVFRFVFLDRKKVKDSQDVEGS